MTDVEKPSTQALTSQEKPPGTKPALKTSALGGIVDYIALPEPSKRRRVVKQSWRIVLIHAGSPSANVVGLEIHDDVVLGRVASQGAAPDFDLSCYDAAKYGVSRQHALLRPTANELFLIDLDSTNGTQVNSVPQETGMARALKHNDMLSLGNLHLMIKIMDRSEAPHQEAVEMGKKHERGTGKRGR